MSHRSKQINAQFLGKHWTISSVQMMMSNNIDEKYDISLNFEFDLIQNCFELEYTQLIVDFEKKVNEHVGIVVKDRLKKLLICNTNQNFVQRLTIEIRKKF